jgi:ribonuclease R
VLEGEQSGKRYRLTDRLRVRLAAVNVDERKIDFVPVDSAESGGGSSRKPAPPNKSGSRQRQRKRGRG